MIKKKVNFIMNIAKSNSIDLVNVAINNKCAYINPGYIIYINVHNNC